MATTCRADAFNREDLKEHMRSQWCEDNSGYREPGHGSKHEPLHDEQDPGPEPPRDDPKQSAEDHSDNPHTEIDSLGDFLSIEYPNVTPLIGTDDDALLVPGEGIVIPGTGGVGKTMFVTGIAASMAIGENILQWRVARPLRTIIYQAELPAPFYQKRIRAIYESYKLANPKRAKKILDNVFVAQIRQQINMAVVDGTAVGIIGADVERYKADVVILDPFLSFFVGQENDNNEVRRALDAIKISVAERYQCGLIITDHQPKYADSDKSHGQQHAIRGAGAKRDWAASVIALNRMKTPVGQHGAVISATVDKMRYGKVPSEPFVLRRDDLSFRHQLIRVHDIEPREVAEVLDNAGNGLTKNKFEDALVTEFSISKSVARSAIKHSVEEGWIIAEREGSQAIIHTLGDKYVDYRIR